MTVQQAIAQGGGPTIRGTERWLKLHRLSHGEVQVLRPAPSDRVLADDILYVNESLF
jgi:polysaccharide export outer membrane protein